MTPTFAIAPRFGKSTRLYQKVGRSHLDLVYGFWVAQVPQKAQLLEPTGCPSCFNRME